MSKSTHKNTQILFNYQEAESEADDDGVGNGDGSEFNVSKVPGKGLGDDVHAVGSDAAEDGGTHDVP